MSEVGSKKRQRIVRIPGFGSILVTETADGGVESLMRIPESAPESVSLKTDREGQKSSEAMTTSAVQSGSQGRQVQKSDQPESQTSSPETSSSEMSSSEISSPTTSLRRKTPVNCRKFCEQLRSHRKRRNLTQREVEVRTREFAAHQGSQEFVVRNTQLSAFEHGRSLPSAGKLLGLAEVYGLGLQELTSLWARVDRRQA